MTTPDDLRQYAPATQRNREPILDVLQRVLPPKGTILEISSGTGEHAVFFAPRLSPRKWLPSDPNPQARSSIAAWRASQPADNLYPPLDIDVCTPVWPVEQGTSGEWLSELDFQTSPIVAIANINMIHISPWSACLGLIAGASRILPPGGILYLYGPFKRDGQHTAPSNAAFDESLQAANPDWGVRNLNDVVAAAQAQHLTLSDIYQMPANNLSVVFQRQRAEGED
ncbi:MAG TPA: SAM-dependent methyltransferase, partial [Cyanobacteria bacterium UBA8803]|nr:SAM-dependent methyltransferase [Cyanobacteria bacterium UBA8803]